MVKLNQKENIVQTMWVLFKTGQNLKQQVESKFYWAINVGILFQSGSHLSVYSKPVFNSNSLSFP